MESNPFEYEVNHEVGLVDRNPGSQIDIAWGIPRDEYRLRLNANFFVEQPTRPNAWYRFWQRVLLGWTWEQL